MYGLPILESSAQGFPTVLARASCFEEVASDAAVYSDPDGVQGCADGLDDAVSGRLRAVAKRGRERCHDFSHESTAKRLAEVYAAALGA